jgi:ATP-binding protein involved in chromosome partitioning
VTDTHRSIQLFRENDVPVLGVVSNMGEFVCDDCGTRHDLFDGPDPIDELDVPVLASVPFSSAMQSPPSPTPGGVPDHARSLAAAVRERLEDVWDVEVPEGAVDLRGVPAEERHAAVSAGFERLDSGETFHLVSDRDPTPVREYLRDIADADPDALAPVEVRRQNPETWHLRTTRP